VDWTGYAFLIPLFPVLGFVLELFFGKYTWRKGGIFANLSIAASLVISLGLLYEVYFKGMAFYEQSWNWFYPGIVVGFTVDPLSIVMVCMVSFVGLLIHIFALGYMGEDPNKSLYFGETALFTGAMLGLILSNNFLQLFVFWEMVGLCSYLLIGFWWHKPEAAAAAKKAWMFCAVAWNCDGLQVYVRRTGRNRSSNLFAGLLTFGLRYHTACFPDDNIPANPCRGLWQECTIPAARLDT
jgi:NADH-quinone oxidoreductase subunit L